MIKKEYSIGRQLESTYIDKNKMYKLSDLFINLLTKQKAAERFRHKYAFLFPKNSKKKSTTSFIYISQ